MPQISVHTIIIISQYSPIMGAEVILSAHALKVIVIPQPDFEKNIISE